MSAGHVAIVGAGPGDPGLLSARALELIASADVILYDRLIPMQALAQARAGAKLVYVGKVGHGESVPQEEIEALLVEHALSGALVVRLKGGDPFIFGRGAEEALRVREAGISFEIVPGVTAALAAAAYAGIPLTHRDRASAVALITAHEDPAKSESAIDWQALADFPGTLVFYMGVRRLAATTQRLIDCGRDPAQAAAVIERGTFPDQRTISATLATIAQAAQDADVRTPAVTLVGSVVELHEQLAWHQPGPLAGRSVAVTRARAQASELAGRLRALGAEVIEAPTIKIQPLHPTLPPLSAFDLLCLTSTNAVELFFDALTAQGDDARALAGIKVAAIGPGTALALRNHGVVADVVPQRSVAESLIEALAEVPVRSALIVRAVQGREVLADALRTRGAEVTITALYETLAEPLDEATMASVRSADYVTFTSSSTVTNLLANGALGDGPRIVSIGPATSATLGEQGLTPHLQAETHDIEGLIAAILADVQ